MKRAKTPPNRIIVIGFMGAGKTTVGRIIARKLKMLFRDLDQWIVRQRKKSIRRIFDEEGESRFRQWEARGLRELLKKKNSVIATGGGVVLQKANRNRIRNGGVVLWVKASPQVIWRRVKGKFARPLLNVNEPRRAMGILLRQREKFYKSVKAITVQNNTQVKHQVDALIRRKGW